MKILWKCRYRRSNTISIYWLFIICINYLSHFGGQFQTVILLVTWISFVFVTFINKKLIKIIRFSLKIDLKKGSRIDNRFSVTILYLSPIPCYSFTVRCSKEETFTLYSEIFFVMAQVYKVLLILIVLMRIYLLSSIACIFKLVILSLQHIVLLYLLGYDMVI